MERPPIASVSRLEVDLAAGYALAGEYVYSRRAPGAGVDRPFTEVSSVRSPESRSKKYYLRNG